jgi:hypothetical protein
MARRTREPSRLAGLYPRTVPSAHAWGDTPKEAMERLKDAVELLK